MIGALRSNLRFPEKFYSDLLEEPYKNRKQLDVNSRALLNLLTILIKLVNYGQFTRLDKITFIAQDTVFRRELQLELLTYNCPLALEAIQFDVQKIEHLGPLT